jgi:FkbM family methyltransferase
MTERRATTNDGTAPVVLRPETSFLTVLSRAFHALKGLFLVKNRIEAVRHIVGKSRSSPVAYRLTNGLVFEARTLKKDRTLVLTLDEIFNEDIYGLHSNLGNGLVVLDIGANVGVYSLYCSLHYDISKVYAFEPDPETFSQLKNNVRINNLDSKIVAVKKAVTGLDGQSVFYADDESSRASSTMRKSGRQFCVETLSIPGLFEELQIDHADIAKIDIEGSEYPAIFNCPKDILRKMKTILVECHGDFAASNARYTKKDLRQFLEDAGFSIDRDEGLMLVAHRT